MHRAWYSQQIAVRSGQAAFKMPTPILNKGIHYCAACACWVMVRAGPIPILRGDPGFPASMDSKGCRKGWSVVSVT